MENFEPDTPKTKIQQYYEYQAWGGTMTFEEWENDLRYDKSLDPEYGLNKEA